jgi:hypothetical protein
MDWWRFWLNAHWLELFGLANPVNPVNPVEIMEIIERRRLTICGMTEGPVETRRVIQEGGSESF